jgi:choline-sulfatase
LQPTNFLFLMPDEHSRRVAGCYGNPVAKTPNLDALAARGTLFTDAYCNSPICVPSRASLATGRYVHETGYWDNAVPYDGRVKSWHHRLSETGHRVVSIGKLHFRHENDPFGFTEQILPMHVVGGKGDLHGLLRRPPRPRAGMRRLAAEIGAGESSYSGYDRQITEATCRWLAGPGRQDDGKPWAAFVSLVCPHFPLIAPKEFFDLYRLEDMPWPLQREPGEQPAHPVVQAFRKYQNYDDYFTQRGAGPHGDRLLLRSRLVRRRPDRPHAGRPRRRRAPGEYRRRLHQRSRRQPRHPRFLGIQDGATTAATATPTRSKRWRVSAPARCFVPSTPMCSHCLVRR